MRYEESRTQASCVAWFRLRYPTISKLLFAVPNGGRRGKITAAILKSEGVEAGVADVLLLYPTAEYHGLCIEFKTAKGRQQNSQKEFQQAVEKQGYKYEIIRSFEQFSELIKSYIGE